MFLLFHTFFSSEIHAEEWLSGARYLRTVSIDVLGRAPTMEEFEQIEEGGDIPDALLEQWLSSEEFAKRVSRFHRQFLWNNTESIQRQQIGSSIGPTDDIWKATFRDQIFRDVYLPYVATCGDFEATMDDDGRPIAYDLGQGYMQEGWVWVEPYWDLENPIKVCAFDAMEQSHSQNGVDCRTKLALSDPDCGCGPNLNFCKHGNDEEIIIQSFDTQVEKLVEHVILEDRPYSDILDSQSMMMNGPIVHYYQYKAYSPYFYDLDFPLVDIDQLPDLNFTDKDTWLEVQLPEAHSGVLTSQSFLMRLMSNRARADRFNTSFMCSSFIGPAGGLPEGGDSATVPDLTQRAGCKYCHARLEPMAAHWGRWTPYGDSWLDPTLFPAYDESCFNSNDPDCDSFYVLDGLTSMEQEWFGWLKSYQFLDERYHQNVESGPKLLVQEGLASGGIQACAVDRAVEHLLRRELGERDTTWHQKLLSEFILSNLSYKSLIRNIVTSEEYRRLK